MTFVVPSLTSVVSSASTIVNFTIAKSTIYTKRLLSRDGSAPNVTVSVPIPQMGTLGPAISVFNNVAVVNVGQKAGYDLWQGRVEINTLATGAVTVEVLEGDKVVDTLLI